MRQILTHKSRSATEIVDIIINTGSFTAPLALPHYRYDNTRRNCYLLEDAMVVKRIKKSGINVHYSSGQNMQRWLDEGKPPLKDFCNRIAKERKLANPRKPKVKVCRGCGCSFETLNYRQKSCKRGCLPANGD